MLAHLVGMVALSLGTLTAEAHQVEPGRTAEVAIPAAERTRTLSVLVGIDDPSALQKGQPIIATLELGEGPALRKALHQGDPDVVWTVQQGQGVSGRVTLQAAPESDRPIAFQVHLADLGTTDPEGVVFEVEPNDSPESAQTIQLGQTLYAQADDRPYLPRVDQPDDAETTIGQDWYRFDYDGESNVLAFLGLEFVDRDVPPDVRLYQLKDGKPVEYTRGIDPQSLQRERPPRPGANKFTTRVLTPGTYYLMVDACQPDYQLRATLYPVPPYLDDDTSSEAVAQAARQAVRVAMDFQLAAGDSWHANTPRQGHPLDRVANPHQETSSCVACHVTHFTTQSALEAVRDGYKPGQPFALRFLTDRLYNNPIPFHGHDQAVWARVIPAPANVLGRLSTITMDFEDLVANHPRNNVHEAISEFLKLYYDGRDQLPPDESNGNNPVSRYKVASDAWRQLDEIFRRTGDDRFQETRDLVERLLPTGEPDNTRDLAAQTIGLCWIDREKHAEKIAANVKRLLELQRADGNWSVKFDPDYPITEMQTGESLFALALAGLTPEHPAVKKGVVALLKSQDEFGGWLDLNPYEHFRTPFRETQWALMALAKLFPGPGTRGWNGPLGPQPATLRTDSASLLVRDLERIWEEPDTALMSQVIAQLTHDAPTVRLAACEALSRVGDRRALASLAARFGDSSKLVRRAAAEAVRSIGNRLNADVQASETHDQVAFVSTLEAALGSPDVMTRRGATRVFAAHFREISQERALADALLKRLDDADPVVQMQAIKGLWRWWYWQSDLDLRNTIEDRLIAMLAEPTHPWVRRNLTDALYILTDENIRYLGGSWIPSLAQESDREAATAALHETINRLGRKYVAVLKNGNALQREGVLRALTQFEERPAVVEGRIGNDTEPALFYDEILPAISQALVGQMADSDPTIRVLALRGLITVRGFRDPALARAVLARRGDEDAEVRRWAAAMAVKFPVKPSKGQADPPLMAVVEDLAASPIPEARVAALEVLGGWGPVEGADRSAILRQGVRDKAGAVRAAAFTALEAFPVLLKDEPIRERIVASMSDPDVSGRIEAVKLVLAHPGLISDRSLRRALEDDAPEHRAALLDWVAKSKAGTADLRLIGVVASALLDADRGVRERALQAIQAHPDLAGNPAVENALRELTDSDNPRQKEIASALLESRGRSSGTGQAGDVLDVAFFREKVLPIFNTMADDGQNCVGCHRSHTILKMVGPERGGHWTDDRVRANYRAALRVVNLTHPTESLILNKPTWESADEAEAQTDPSKKAHAGGVRFEKGSPQYQALLDWINGARLPKGDRAASTR